MDASERRRRRKERLLTFSPGEWLWVVFTLLFLLGFALLG
jgi:hypothetical protein